MTDAQRIEELSSLLSEAIHRLGMKSYEIDDPHLSHQCEIEADEFHQRMCDILYS